MKLSEYSIPVQIMSIIVYVGIAAIFVALVVRIVRWLM
jgi:hypothetical protein